MHDLLQASSDVKITVSPEQVLIVEQQTRGQTGTRLWNCMRSGRITASRFKAACRTDPCLPSRTLVAAICFPELAKFSTSATSWGCDNEKIAREMYIKKDLKIIENFLYRNVDFLLMRNIHLLVHPQME